MTRLLVCAGLALATAAFADGSVVKIISDKGSFFVKIDPKSGITEGTELAMVADDKGSKEVGKATVMELKGALARITLDDEAMAAKAKFARLPAAGSAPAASNSGPPPPPAKEAPKLQTPPTGPEPKGRLAPGFRVTINNDSEEKWTDCELHYDDGRFYNLGEVPAKSDDTVMSVKFSKPPPPPEPLYDHVVVTCDEGETKFMFDNPRSPGQLKGYVENGGGGKIVVYNQSDSSWNRCDVRKPDGTHYILGTLKAHDQERIRSGLFKAEAAPEMPKATTLWLACKQGVLIAPIK